MRTTITTSMPMICTTITTITKDEKESHAEFHAEYRLQCDDPAAITSLTLTYFDVFAGAEELEVNLITDDGQSRQEVTPAEPVVNLGGN